MQHLVQNPLFGPTCHDRQSRTLIDKDKSSDDEIENDGGWHTQHEPTKRHRLQKLNQIAEGQMQQLPRYLPHGQKALVAVQQNIAGFVGVEPDKGERYWISNPCSQSGRDHVSAHHVGDGKTDDEMKADERRKGRKNACGKSHRHHMR